MSVPFFTVVIPLYNKAPYVERALKSVFAQTFTDFEVIVVDDGSTDGGGEIVKQFNDPRLRLITQTNQGVAAARNRGIREAKADYIAFLDADDEWLPNHLETHRALIDKHGRQVSIFGTNYLTKVSEKLTTEPYKSGIYKYHEGVYKREFWLWTSATSMSRSLLIRLNGFRDYSLGQDIDMWFRAGFHSDVAFSSVQTAIYHDVPNSAVKTPLCKSRHPDFIEWTENAKGGNNKHAVDFALQRHSMLIRSFIDSGDILSAKYELRRANSHLCNYYMITRRLELYTNTLYRICSYIASIKK